MYVFLDDLSFPSISFNDIIEKVNISKLGPLKIKDEKKSLLTYLNTHYLLMSNKN